MKIVPEEEEKIDYEVLGTRYPIINWESKFYDYGHFGRELIYYRVFRADGSSRWIKTFSEMIKLFDRMDLVEIHSLVMKRFETTPPEGIDLLLWGDLRIMFESKEDDELWKNQEEWKWKRIFKKRTKNKAKTTKPSTGWKRQSQIEAKVSQSQKVNPDKVKSQPSHENTT
ncbi:hypothetical protein Tco_0869204 [Tanacetum coccineum]